MQNEPTLMDWLFIGEYVKDWKAAAAMRRAGYVGNFASDEAARRLKKPAVAAEIAAIRANIVKTVQLSTNLVAQDIINVLTADPRDLYEIRTLSCRHCHGVDHLYQMTMNEYRRAEFTADATGKKFNPLGGYGFNPHQDPHPDCPECFGKGIIEEVIKDVRFLPPEAAALYMGGKRGKHGLEVMMRSKDAAREAAARFLGMNKETLKIVDGKKKLEELSDEELAAMAQGESPE